MEPFSDWVLSDYTLHGKGAVWHIRPKEAHKPDRPADPRKGLFSAHRPLRSEYSCAASVDPKGQG